MSPLKVKMIYPFVSKGENAQADFPDHVLMCVCLQEARWQQTFCQKRV